MKLEMGRCEKQAHRVSVLPPEDMLTSGAVLLPRAIFIWMACAATLGQGDVQARVTVKGQACVHGPTEPGVCVDSCGLSY